MTDWRLTWPRIPLEASIWTLIGCALSINLRTKEIYRALWMRKYKAANTGELVHKLMSG